MATSLPSFKSKLSEPKRVEKLRVGVFLLKIKICGLTQPEDVRFAATLGADYFGFVLAKSPRQVSLSRLQTLCEEVPSCSQTVAVMVNPQRQDIDEALGLVHIVQLHGDEDPELCRRYGARVWKAFRIKKMADFERLEVYRDVGAYLFDSFQPGVAGGTGSRFAWDLLEGRVFSKLTFLAGGLNPDNVVAASRIPCIDGLDVSSGLECAPGIKDAQKMTQFFQALGKN